MDAIPPNLGGFAIAADQVTPLVSPSDFYNELISRSQNAQRRIVLTSLYLGSGDMEQKLVATLQETMQARKGVKVSILLDYLRGTRGVAEGKSSVCLLKDIAVHAEIYLYHTPHLSGLTKRLLSERNNEIIGLQHMKLYIFDNDVIISGANLSDSYFTRRQDRYVEFRNCPELADYLEKVVATVGQNSFKLTADGSLSLHPECKVHPFQGSSSEYISHIRHKIEELIQQLKPPSDGDTVIYPLIQMGSFGIRQEHEILRKILASQDPDIQMTLASGYFNCVREYEDLMLAKTIYPLKIITASPEANGFFGASGPSGYVPAMYSWVIEQFLAKMDKFAREEVTLYEYSRPEWTFHAKGLWIETKDKSATLVGSSNYGYRSLHRDLEAQVLLVTKNEDLRARLDEEKARLMDYCTVLDSAALRRAEHHVPTIARTCTYDLGSLLLAVRKKSFSKGQKSVTQMDLKDLGALNFGSPIRFRDDGSFEESESDSGSPLQLRKAAPLSRFDREPVTIPQNHPLNKKSNYLSELIRNIEKTTQLARETGVGTRSLFNQSCHSAGILTRSTLGQLDEIGTMLDGIEDRIEKETHMADRFWKEISHNFEQCVHPSLHIDTLKDQVAAVSSRYKNHGQAAANLRRGYMACDAASQSLEQCQMYHCQITDVQVPSGQETLRSSTDTVAALCDLSSALFQLQEGLSSLRRLSPTTFRVCENRKTIGNHMEETLTQLRCLDWALTRYMPVIPRGATPVPSQATTSLYSDSGKEEMSWNPVDSSLQESSTQSVTSLLSVNSTMSSGSDTKKI